MINIHQYDDKRKWIVTNHICMECNGRILQCVEGNGMTPGGNPTFKCSCCGKIAYNDRWLCWCNFSYRNSSDNPYICVPSLVAAEYPDIIPLFERHGNNYQNQEVCVVNYDNFRDFIRKHENE